MNNKDRLEVLAILRQYLYISNEEIISPEHGRIQNKSIKMQSINPRDIMTLHAEDDFKKVLRYLTTTEKKK